MKTLLVFGFRAIVAMAAMAGWTGAMAQGLFSSTGPVIAMLGNALYLGEATGNIDRTGTIAIKSQATPVSCNGQFTFGAKLGNNGTMQCTDGTTASFQFERLGLTKGHGAGVTSKGALTFTYGLTAEESKGYLKLPAGKSLGLAGNAVVLIDVAPALPGVVLVSEPLP